MSNTYYETEKLSLTAFVSKDKSLQITMPYNKRYASLTEKEAVELAINLLLRVNGNISATGDEKGIRGIE